MLSTVTLRDISSQHLPASVPYAVLAPSRPEPLPLFILLLGAGGTRDSIFDLQPLFDAWWAESTVPPMIIATPTSSKAHRHSNSRKDDAPDVSLPVVALQPPKPTPNAPEVRCKSLRQTSA
jgi:hypothetical protein